MKNLKFKNLSPTPLLLVLAIFVFVTVPLRVFQLGNCIDPLTGFWSVRDFTVLSIYIIGIVFALVAFILSFFSEIMAKPVFTEEKDIPLGIFSVLFVIGMIFSTITSVTSLLDTLSTGLISKASNVFGYLISSGVLALGFESLFGILSAIYFCFVTISYFSGKNKYEKSRLLALSPALWAMVRIIAHFIDPVNFKNVSQLFLQLIMLAFASIFFLSFARIASDINGEHSMWIFWFSGTCAAFFGFVTALAPLILIITGKGSLIPSAYPFNLADLTMAIFITSFLFTVTPLTSEVDEDN